MKKILKILCILVIVFLIVVVILGLVYSKYSSSNAVEVSSGIANPKIYVQADEQSIDVLNDEVISYEFSVKNYDETSSETSFKYYINFDIGTAPLLLTIYRVSDDSKELVDLTEFTTTEYEILELGETENFYMLELEYDKNSDEILEEDFKLNIYLQAIQEEVV